MSNKYADERKAFQKLKNYSRYGSHKSKVRAKKLLRHPMLTFSEAFKAFRQ